MKILTLSCHSFSSYNLSHSCYICFHKRYHISNNFFEIIRIIFRQSSKNVFFVHFENRKWVTTVELMSTRSRIFRSLVIFLEKIIQIAWTNTWSYSMYEIFTNDWIDNELDLTWLKKLFHLETKHLDDRRLLIINDHASHVFVEFVEFCWKMNIVSLCLSSHITHYLQSLDVDCFASLNRAYRKKLNEKNKTNVVHIIKFDFLDFLEKARRNIMNETTIMSNFAKTNMIQWMISQFVSNLLTKSDLYSYDSSQVLNQLKVNDSCLNTSTSSIDIIKLNRTLINKREIENLIEFLNKYTFIYKLKLSRVKKSMNAMIVITILAQNSIKLLFKINMTKETRKKKDERRESNELSIRIWACFDRDSD